ncbi:TonB-dependent receptor [Paraglaciecola sp.]|uniref:TonB-dependent receptor n=1 Tax=Paraglaciecola sp. TaxID=1920173 RepID=UPI003EF51633
MSARFKLKPIVITMMPILLASSANLALAQDKNEEADKKKKEAELEVIEVTGFRGSVIKSMNDKRLADGIQDSIFAEDIGKTTDQNIGDALSRITGVTVQEEDGEGTKISVRGAGANLNQISLNGVVLTGGLSGGTSDQSVDLSTFSADILNSLSVVKTPSADHDEGSLGANVILKTFRPLDVNKDRRSVEIQGRYNDFAEESDHKLAGTFSSKFLDETVGIIITAADETQSTRRDEISGDWLRPYDTVNVPAGRATSLQTGQATTTDQVGIYRKSLGYNANLNNRDRQTATVGIQFVPTDAVDMQLDLSYSKQDLSFDNHKINTGTPNFTEPENWNYHNNDEYADDPQSTWWTIDESNHTIVKSLNRFASGTVGRSTGGSETENKVATFRMNYQITDDLVMDLNVGYSGTQYNTKPNANINTATWGRVPLLATLGDVPVEVLEPVGYDCTTGACQIVTGTNPFTYVPEGNNNNQANETTSAFNPLDPYMHHLGYMSQNSEDSSDINKSIFLDFDWDVDFAGVTKVEFGAKGSSRVKDVYSYNTSLKNNTGTAFNPLTGEPIEAGVSTTDILLVDVLQPGELPLDNFMDGLAGTNNQYSQELLNGWGLISAEKAFEERYGVPNTVESINDSGSRRLEQDNVSLYAKVNFEYLDGQLTGNLGLRYVKTDYQSFGFASLGYHSDDRTFDVNQMIYQNQLANSSLDACPPEDFSQMSTPLTSPVLPCYEPRIITDTNGDAALQVTYNGAGEVASIDINNGNRDTGWWWIWRHTDQSTAITDQNIAMAEELGIDIKQFYSRAYEASGESKNSMLLPSLNLNYAINDETIARFAASKTMARPRFDSLRPNFNVNEQVWGELSTGFLNNPQLKPLESKNLDLSFEWYFNKSGYVSAALFRKDMSNFEESVKDIFYYQDLRTDYLRESITPDEVFIVPEDGMTPQNSTCMPSRVPMNGIKNSMQFICEPVLLNIVRNGAGALNQGIELAHSQTYDFLPGLWSHLGTTFNYTYTKSESDAEVLEGTGSVLKALPQAYTPRHTANATVYWEHDGLSLRLSNRYNSEQLVNRGLESGVSWADATNRLDFSANYRYSDSISFSLHALNLTDTVHRTFFTSTRLAIDTDTEGNPIILDEGNALDGGVDKSRTINQYKTGRMFRLSTRILF